MRLSSGYETKKARVEMLPLIDVVFLLLVFFIYAMVSMALHRGIELELPSAASAQLDARNYISISIAADNRIYLNGQPIEKQALVKAVLLLHADSGQPVYIEGDRKAALGPAIELLDQLTRSGIEKVSFSCAQETP